MVENVDFNNRLLNSLNFGFIDNKKFQGDNYSPKALINNADNHSYVLSDIQEELMKSKCFYFSVAFITKSGIALIKSQLSDLAEKNIGGKILISPYLDFNDPLAMMELLKFKNVEIRITPPNLQMHSKFYLFEQDDKQVLISGSSNLTGAALKINYEWNIKITSTNYGDLIQTTKSEFDRIWKLSEVLTEETILKYKVQRNPKVSILIEDEVTKEYISQIIEPNKMQEQALEGLRQIRNDGADKALVISATGTGKTFLSAFDVRQFGPKKMLFIVHREQILNKSLEDFQKVLRFEDEEACIYKKDIDISNKKYIFATIQTLSKDEHLQKFASDHFDYILIDEVHKAGANSYKKIMNYFSPKFFLGMTATPERTDGQNIYELFDYNIAYEIRLQEALDNDMLCPFIYFGVTDIKVNGELLDEKTSFSNLVTDERVKHILDKIDYYGYSGESVRGLIFCSSKNEAHSLSEKFNSLGLRTQALTGDDRQDVRIKAVQALENGDLDYILTVDIFNEGIDIPSVNQVVILRNTESSIIFIQQLGRGLRKHSSKEYVTIIDFIGNYSNNYLIPIALFGDQSMNKDNYRREMRDPNQINGLTTINFEEVAKEYIFKSITSTTLSSLKILKEKFTELQNLLGRIPYMKDYIENDSIDPLTFFDNSNFKNYSDVINKFTDKELMFTEDQLKWLNFLTFEILNGKRKHELILLKLLLKNDGVISYDEFVEKLISEGLITNKETIDSVGRVLDLSFLKDQEKKKYDTEALVTKVDNNYILSDNAKESLSNSDFKILFNDIIETGLLKSTKYPDIFTLEQKYSRRDVLKLLNFNKDEPSLNIGGYKIDKETNSCPIFITYNKDEGINDTIKYEDELLNESTLKWLSKNKRTIKSPDVSKILNSNENGLRIELFIIKNDNEGGEFYYLGPLQVIENTATMLFKLKNPIENSLYKYLTNK